MRGRRHKLQVSTFPFLAVLLCAMGSLILVLLVMDRKAHKAAQARAQREAARLAEETAQNEADRRAEIERKRQEAKQAWEKKREELHARLSNEQIEMELQMRKVRDQLSEIAARLRYEQDTSTQLRRKVQDERGKIQTERQRLRTLLADAGQTSSTAKESSKTLQRMTSDLLQMEQALKDLKAARQREQHTFSVVPYHGRRGENRRPIYVECTLTGVIFHPERRAMPITERSLRFLQERSSDANAPDDVRAEVERRIAHQRDKFARAGTPDDKPYLLLLVRPDGINTYDLFRALLSGLDLDFGYEFIDADWILDFPADDEEPSTQPWRVATKTPPARAAPPASSNNGSNAHAAGMPSETGSVPQGIPPGTAGGSARWTFRGPPGTVGSGSGGAGSGMGGSGAVARGGASGGSGSPAASGGPSSGLFGQPGGGGSGYAGGGSASGSSRGGRGQLPLFAGSAGEGGSGAGEPGPEGASGNGPHRPGGAGWRGPAPPYVPGAALSSGPAAAGSESASLGTPQALSPGGGIAGAAGNGGMGASGNGAGGTGKPGAGAGRGGPAVSGASGGNAGSAMPGFAPQGRGALARGPGGRSGQPGVPGGTAPGTPGGSSTGQPGSAVAPGSDGASATTMGPRAPDGGTVGASPGQIAGQTGGGGTPGGRGGPPSSAHPPQAVYPGIDPLMPRRPGDPPPAERPPEETPSPAPRKKLLVQSGGGGEGDGSSSGPPNPFATPSYQTPRRRKPASMSPAWVHGGRDWPIFVECLADGVKLYPSEDTFTLAQAAAGGANNPLVAAIRKMIERRQALRRPGEPPFYPQVRLLVRPENVRAFLTVYPALEALPIPKKRQNLDSDDDVADIINGANP